MDCPLLVNSMTIPVCDLFNLHSCGLEKASRLTGLSPLQTDEVKNGQVEHREHVNEGYTAQGDSGAEPQLFGLYPRHSSLSPRTAFRQVLLNHMGTERKIQ